jgi:uncharacterized OB-fold protein
MAEYRGMEIVPGETDSEFRPYFEEVARCGRLVMRRCAACGLLRYPPGAGCPWCASLEWEWAEVSGSGTVYSYEVVTQPILPGFADRVPYVVALVELDEQRGLPTPDDGLRLVANIVRPDGEPEAEERVGIGTRVDLSLQPFVEGLVLPQFSVVEGSGPAWRL